MLRIILISLLMFNAIFWGIYPSTENSPLSSTYTSLGISIKTSRYINIVIGFISYIIAVGFSQIKNINELWY